MRRAVRWMVCGCVALLAGCVHHQHVAHERCGSCEEAYAEAEVYEEPVCGHPEADGPRCHEEHVEVYEEPAVVYAPSYSGFTECGDFLAGGAFSNREGNQCQPNQFCADITFSRCAIGCLSDVNCASPEQCIKAPGAQIGTCG